MPTITNVEERSMQIKMRRAEINATLAEWRRACFVDGISTPYSERVTLEAEDAALALEARQISQRMVMAQLARRKQQNSDLLAQLIAVLNERGLSDVIMEAKSRVAAP
jgi:hypothetical protein